jgi:hypothetical protein
MSGAPTLLSSSGMRHAWAHKTNVHLLSKVSKAAADQQDEDMLARITTFKQQSAAVHKLYADTTSTRLNLADAFLHLGKAGQVLKEAMFNGVFADSALERNSHDAQHVQTLLAATGQMQLHFHDSFGLGWQQRLLTALNAEIEASSDVQVLLERYEHAVREDAYYTAKLEELSSRGKAPPGSDAYQRNESKLEIASKNLHELIVNLSTALTERQAARRSLLQTHGPIFEDAVAELATVFQTALSSPESGSRDNAIGDNLDTSNIYGDIGDSSMVENFRRGLFDFKSQASKQAKASAANFKFAVAHKKVTTAKGQHEDECAAALASYRDVDEQLRNLQDILDLFAKHWLAGWLGVAEIAEDLVALDFVPLESRPDAGFLGSRVASIKDSALKSSQSFSDQVLRTLQSSLDAFAFLPESALRCEEAVRTHLHYEEKLRELILNKNNVVSLAKHQERIARNQEKKVQAGHASREASEKLMEALRRCDDVRLQTGLQVASAVVNVQLTYYSDVLADMKPCHSTRSAMPTRTE